MLSTYVMQVVLLTDGMDTRPYRLNWPSSTLMFDISPDELYKIAAEKLEGALFYWFCGLFMKFQIKVLLQEIFLSAFVMSSHLKKSV